jgi:hypothetical protein
VNAKARLRRDRVGALPDSAEWVRRKRCKNEFLPIPVEQSRMRCSNISDRSRMVFYLSFCASVLEHLLEQSETLAYGRESVGSLTYALVRVGDIPNSTHHHLLLEVRPG